MFLRNYYNIQAINSLAAFLPMQSSDAIAAFPSIFSGTFGAGSLSLKRASGVINNNLTRYYPMLAPKTYIGEYDDDNPGYNTAENCIGFGSGDTAVTFDDYKLASPFAYSVIGVRASTTNTEYASALYDAETDTLSVTVRVSVTNKSNESITIREFGLATSYYYIYREVLTTPFTLDAGETKTFQYTINCSIPEAS